MASAVRILSTTAQLGAFKWEDTIRSFCNRTRIRCLQSCRSTLPAMYAFIHLQNLLRLQAGLI